MTTIFKKIQAPFTPEQIKALNVYQNDERNHPFCCLNDGDDAHIKHEFEKQFPGKDFEEHIREGKAQGYSDPTIIFKQTSLIATEQGWICPVCDYTQNWAHGFMAEPAKQ